MKAKKKKEHKARALKTHRAVTGLATETVAESQEAVKRLAKCLTKGLTKHVVKLQKFFTRQVALTERILQQTQEKLSAVSSIEDRIVSFFYRRSPGDPQSQACQAQ